MTNSCVNALERALLISTEFSDDEFNEALNGVSMPLNGLFSFLLIYRRKGVHIMVGVNALERALLISTDKKKYSKKKTVRVVSMPLNGLFSFLRYSVIYIITEK